MTESVRLAKRLVEILSCSRREAEIYIEGGWVDVDGVIVEEPQFRVAQQQITLHADATLEPPEPVTLLFHQPLDASGEAVAIGATPLISVGNHIDDDPSGIRPLKRHFSKLTPTLPLEPRASGLVVFTQDWRVARKLVDDAATVEQEYIVEVKGELSSHGLKQLNHGLSYMGRTLLPAKVSWQNETRLRFAAKGLRPGQITHMCASVGVAVCTIKRIRIGKISMAKLPLGEWRYLSPGERF